MAPTFFCNSHALLGESREYCTKTKQEWPDSGSTLENIFVIFTKSIPRRIFLYCKHFGVDGKLLELRNLCLCTYNMLQVK